jgi:hypothetical protein
VSRAYSTLPRLTPPMAKQSEFFDVFKINPIVGTLASERRRPSGPRPRRGREPVVAEPAAVRPPPLDVEEFKTGDKARQRQRVDRTGNSG